MKACTPSLNFETCFSISSAEKLSETSQPVKSVSAPRLAPPAMKRRRVGSGISLVASLTRSFLSTPGIRSLRMRPMMLSSNSYLSMIFSENQFPTFPDHVLAPDDHGAQAFRHQYRQRDMHHQEGADRGHAEEMHVARHVIAAEQRRQILQLHRLPDRKTRQHDHDADDDNAGIEQLLHVVVLGQVVMRELAGQRRPGIRDHAARGDRQKLPAEAAGGEAEHDIDEAVDHQQPHRREMPKQRTAEPAAKGDAA